MSHCFRDHAWVAVTCVKTSTGMQYPEGVRVRETKIDRTMSTGIAKIDSTRTSHGSAFLEKLVDLISTAIPSQVLLYKFVCKYTHATVRYSKKRCLRTDNSVMNVNSVC